MARDFSKETVVDLSSVRQEKIEEKRREYERVVFRSSFGIYAHMERVGLMAIEVIDISEGGIQFQVPESSTYKLDIGETFPIRIYFATDHFISIDVKVMRSFSAIENGFAVHRYGCLMDKSMSSYSAIFHFVQFINKCAEHGHRDEKSRKVYF